MGGGLPRHLLAPAPSAASPPAALAREKDLELPVDRLEILGERHPAAPRVPVRVPDEMGDVQVHLHLLGGVEPEQLAEVALHLANEIEVTPSAEAIEVAGALVRRLELRPCLSLDAAEDGLALLDRGTEVQLRLFSP